MSDTLRYAKENAEFRAGSGEKWGGWFQEKDWIGWQEHMSALVSRLDDVLTAQAEPIELLPVQEQQPAQKMC